MQNNTNCLSPRLLREIKSLKTNPPPGISCYPANEDQQNNILSASIVGTTGSPYEKGLFQLEVIVTERYPFEPPRVRFTTPIYHPNVDSTGRICLDMLKMPPGGSWKPIFTVEGLLMSIQYLMTHPNPDDPLMAEIEKDFDHTKKPMTSASQYKYNQEQFNKDAENWTLKHACTSIRSSVNENHLTKISTTENKRKSDSNHFEDIEKRQKM